MKSDYLDPACLPRETQVGPWRVLDLLGRGAYGAVYRARAAESEASSPVALKLALYPRDERFAREVELLSRIRHLSVPRLLGHGVWQHPAGVVHPYLIMELVEGVPLYDWARTNLPSSRYVLQVLAIVMRALEAAGPRPAREQNARCCPELSAGIARMLSPSPEARGSAQSLAAAMEQAARCAGPEADMPLFIGDAPRPLRARSFLRSVPPRTPHRALRRWLMAASLGCVLALGVVWMLGVRPDAESTRALIAKQVDARDGGTVAVGDSVLTSPGASARPLPSALSAIALDMPPKPLPGQTRPDANGRRPRRGQIPIRGGC